MATPLCPYCRSPRTRPSAFRWSDLVFFPMLMVPWRCRDCRRRWHVARRFLHAGQK